MVSTWGAYFSQTSPNLGKEKERYRESYGKYVGGEVQKTAILNQMSRETDPEKCK